MIHARINISLLIGLFLLVIALKEFSATVAQLIDRMMAFEKTYFLLMGIRVWPEPIWAGHGRDSWRCSLMCPPRF